MTHGQKKSWAVCFCSRFLKGVLVLAMAGLLLPLQITGAGAAEVVDRIVAVVNDEIIVLQDVKSMLTSLQQQIETAGLSEQEKQKILSERRESLIKELVNQKLIVQAAAEYSDWLTVDDEEVDASIQRIKEQNNFTDEQFQEALAQEGLTMEQLRTQLRDSSLASKVEQYEVVSKIVVTKADVTQYYNANSEKYEGKTTYHLRNIFIKASASDAVAKAAAAAKIDAIFAELEAGTPFEALAREYSDSAYADEGGELGNFVLSDLSPNLRAAIEPLSPGEATEALETSDGYQILFVQQINKESNISLDSVYNDIETELYKQRYQERYETWIEGLRENAHIKIIH